MAPGKLIFNTFEYADVLLVSKVMEFRKFAISAPLPSTSPVPSSLSSHRFKASDWPKRWGGGG